MDSQNNNTPKFSIIIPTWKHLQDCLIPCLESVKKFTDFSETECLVVANGCGDDGTREYVESLGDGFRLIWIDEQSGYTKSVNAGIREARGEFLIPLNNDCVLLDQSVHKWIEVLYKPFSDPQVAITGPITNYCSSAQKEFLIFFCVMIRRDALNQLGGQLDEAFSPGGGEDTAFCCEAERAGWKMVDVGGPSQVVNRGDPSLPAFQQNIWINSFPIYHAAGVSFGSPEMFDDYQKVIARNGAELQRRYGVNIERAKTIEGWMADSELEWLARQAKKASVVIELGSWHGRSTRAIADNLPEGGVCYAVDSWNGSSGEPDAHATAKLREGDDAYMAFWHNNYDHILSGRIIPVRMQGANAAAMLRYRDIKAEMVFVDADHSYEGCKADILNFRELVKDGGLLCGHDYGPDQLSWVGVQQAVNELVPNAQCAPNTTIWYARPSEATALQSIIGLSVTESYKGYGGFFCTENQNNLLPA